jgi:spore coat polysaccharide biosynthesis protein SpsF
MLEMILLWILGGGPLQERETITVILQARMSSTRLPGKVLSILNGHPMIYWQIERIRKVQLIDRVIIATSVDSSDDQLVELANNLGFEVFRGDLNDVYDRYLQCIEVNNINGIIVRLTADCPLVMPELLTQMLEIFLHKKPDYLSNTIQPTFPDGLDVEICTVESFRNLQKHNLTAVEREHVTFGFHSRQDIFRCINFSSPMDNSNLRWTVDYPEDLLFVRQVYSAFVGSETIFGITSVMLAVAELEIENTIPGSMRNIALQTRIED